MTEFNKNIENNLKTLFKKWSGLYPDKITQLPHSGSKRIYFRLESNNKSAIGAYNSNLNENIAFIDFTKQFLKHRINVPQIYSEDLNQNIYLISDLGDQQLLSWLIAEKSFSDKALSIYKKVIQELVRIQVVAGRDFDFSKCFPFKLFNKKAILFDLNYFKTNFLDGLNISYNKYKLENEFDLFSDYLLGADNDFFMFRDFQARNIILKNNEPYFIDYQGGRKGALQYDLVSLLFQAKAQIPEEIKINLLNYYLKIVKLFLPVNNDEFIEYYYTFALIRVLQTFGAYGLRGIIERKSHFLESIPFAINNLIQLKDKVEILNKLNEIKNIINIILNTEIKYNG